jgi:hypothetical protein
VDAQFLAASWSSLVLLLLLLLLLLQCVFANYLYEWTADNTPRTQRRSIFSVNLPHSRAVNAAPMRLVVASREFFSMLHVLKTVLLAPQRQVRNAVLALVRATIGT